MSEFKKGDLVVATSGTVFEVYDIMCGSLYSCHGYSWSERDCCRIKPLDDTKEIKLVDKPKPLVFDPNRCNRIDWVDADLVLMEHDGMWKAITIYSHPVNGLFLEGIYLYDEVEVCDGGDVGDIPIPGWEKTKTLVKDILESLKDG